jgi:polynucleotide 5'-hydroxyl-kinase GRC3/NOL9
MDIVPEPQWQALVPKLRGRNALLMGRSDTGKTTLARYILGELLPDPAGVSFVDADVGQSSLGPPGTISMRTFYAAQEISGAGYDLMCFAGTVSPASRIPEIISMTAQMVQDVRASGASGILVDTTGLVDGLAGRELKLGKIRAVKPDIIIAIEREDELGHILSAVRGPDVCLLKAAGSARQKTRSERVQYRNARLAEYFRHCRTQEFSLDKVRLEWRGKRYDTSVAPLVSGTVLGLNTMRETLALGLIERLAEDRVIIRTPLVSPNRVRIVEVGDFTFGASH